MPDESSYRKITPRERPYGVFIFMGMPIYLAGVTETLSACTM